jgi:hypothetical protein
MIAAVCVTTIVCVGMICLVAMVKSTTVEVLTPTDEVDGDEWKYSH